VIEWPDQREAAEHLRRRLLAACERLHIPVKFKARVLDSDRYAGAAFSDRIEVCSTLAIIESAATLIHELGHECLHFDARGQDCGFTSEFEETEALAVQQAVLERYGVVPSRGVRLSKRVNAAVDRIVREVETEQQMEAISALQKFNAALETL
jgi:hypothetical protein